MCSSLSVWGHVLNSFHCEFTKWLGTIFCGQVHWILVYVTIGKLARNTSHGYARLGFSLVKSLTCVWLFDTPWTAAQLASLSITKARSLLKLMSIKSWCHPTISSFVLPFYSHLQSFSASEFSQMSQFFALGGQSIGVSASASVLPMNIQDWFPLGWTGWVSLQSKELSRVFSNTTVQKHQFFGAQFSLKSSSQIIYDYWEKNSLD